MDIISGGLVDLRYMVHSGFLSLVSEIFIPSYIKSYLKLVPNNLFLHGKPMGHMNHLGTLISDVSTIVKKLWSNHIILPGFLNFEYTMFIFGMRYLYTHT